MNVGSVILVGGLLSASGGLLSGDELSATPLESVLSVGSRVRVRSAVVQGRPKGLVTALDESVLTLAADGGVPVKIPVDSLISIETSIGRNRNALRGLVIGAVSGLLFGLTADVDNVECHFPDSTSVCSRREAVVGGTLALGAIGAGIGALIKTDRWATVNLDAPRAQARRPSPGITLVAIRF